MTNFVLAQPRSFSSSNTHINLEHNIVNSYLKAFDLKTPENSSELISIEDQISKIEKNKVARGGIDTGGGTLIQSPEGFGLLDLYLYNPKVFQSQYTNPENIQETQALKKLGIELLINKKNLLVFKVRSHLQKWQATSPLIVSQILLALDYLPFYYLKESLKSEPIEYFLPATSTLKIPNLKAAALFDEKFGVRLGFDELKLLPEQHQIALVIHECLRLINFTGNFYLTNEKIQRLTAELINEPDINSTVDRSEYLVGEIAFDMFNFTKFIYEVKFFAADVCKKNYQANSSFCLISIEDSSFKVFLEHLNKGFSELYLMTTANHTIDLQKDINQAYLLVIKGENMQLRGILNNAVYLKKYLALRSQFMQLDSLIDKTNAQ